MYSGRIMSRISQEERERIISIFCSINVVKYGKFTLKDGTISPIYIDLRILPNFPNEFKEVIETTSRFLKRLNLTSQFDGIIAPPLAGIPFGVALALNLNKEFYLARIQPKSHGTKKLIEGDITNKRILIIDDVITSGSSKIPIINTIRDNKGIPISLFVFVNRIHSNDELIKFEHDTRIKINSLLSLDDLINEEPLSK